MKAYVCAFALLVGLSLVCGCGGKTPATLVQIEAEVQINGKPAEGIQVTMMPDITAKNKGPSSIGTSEAGGKIVFRTMKDNLEGLVEGAHKATGHDIHADRAPQGKESKPPRISSSFGTEAGGLKVTVKAGEKLILNFGKK